MFKIHTSDGKTTPIDLSSDESHDEWMARFRNKEFQKTITGVSIIKRCGSRVRCPNCSAPVGGSCEKCGHDFQSNKCNAGVQYSLTRPQKIDGVHYELETIESPDGTRNAEKITCYAGDICLTMLSHANQPAARVILAKVGKRRYNPTH